MTLETLEAHGWMYGAINVLGADAIVLPLCAPELSMGVAELLP